MNKKVLLSFLSVALVFTLTACGAKNKETSNLGAVQEILEEDTSGVIFGSVKDLMASGKAVKCTFSSDEDGVEMSGVTYISKNKVRNDVSYTINGGEFKSHMVVNGDYTYYWDSGKGSLGKGTKMKTDMEEDDFNESDFLSDEDFIDDVDEMEGMMEMDSSDEEFDCQSWKVDNKLFTIPNNIEFEDHNKRMEEMKKQIKEDNKRFKSGEQSSPIESTDEMCEFCDMAPDPAGCRKTLNCEK